MTSVDMASHGSASRCMARQAWLGIAGRDVASRGLVWLDPSWHGWTGLARVVTSCRGLAGLGEAWQARRGTSVHGGSGQVPARQAWLGPAGLGVALRGSVRQSGQVPARQAGRVTSWRGLSRCGAARPDLAGKALKKHETPAATGVPSIHLSTRKVPVS